MFCHFLEVQKAFATVWINGLLCKLFTEQGTKGRMWLAIKDICTDVKAFVLYSIVLFIEFDVLQSTSQGQILIPYRFYINSLLNTLSDHFHTIPQTCICSADRRISVDFFLVIRGFMTRFRRLLISCGIFYIKGKVHPESKLI